MRSGRCGTGGSQGNMRQGLLETADMSELHLIDDGGHQGGSNASKRKKRRGWLGEGVKRRLAEPSLVQV